MNGIYEAEWRESAVECGAAKAMEAKLAELCGLSPAHAAIAARLLARRGVAAREIEEFLNPSFARLPDPFSIPGIREASAAILDTVVSGGKIVVFGDYDVDGVSATAILVRVLQSLGADVSPFIPLRNEEGYGMSGAALRRLFGEHPSVSLVITVDNGITAAEEIAGIRARGVKVVVTDHHMSNGELPDCEALVNPHLAADPAGGSADLCGAGVAFMLAYAMLKDAPARGVEKMSGGKQSGTLAVLAGLATVADAVPLSRANRVLSAESFSRFRAHAPIGLSELLDRGLRKTADNPTARDFGYILAPRLNACGRVADAMLAYRLLMCGAGGGDAAAAREEARMLAFEVDGCNSMRRGIENAMCDEARAQAGADFAAPAFAAEGAARRADGSPGWSAGVAGIVAARLVEDLGVPCAIAARGENGECNGSVRAPNGYNIHEALGRCAPVLMRFGGHAAAGGFTVKPGAFGEFRAMFAEACASQNPEGGRPPADFDMWLDRPSVLDCAWMDFQRRMEPFGEGNPEPVFGFRGVRVEKVRICGKDGVHLSFMFKMPYSTERHAAVWWRHGADAEEVRQAGLYPFDMLASPALSDYGDSGRHVEWRVAALRPSGF